MKINPTKKYIKNILIIILILIISLMTIELSLRFFFPQDLKITRFDPILEQELIPGKQTMYASPGGVFTKEYNHPIRISSQGLREDKIYPKKDDAYRIITIGSSFTLGAGVELEETFSKLLEKKLNATNKVEILNFGIQASKPDNQFSLLVTKAKEFHPNMVIMNVPTPTMVRSSKLYSIENGSIERKTLQPPSTQMKIRAKLMEKSHLWSFLLRYFSNNQLISQVLIKAGLFNKPRSSLFGVKNLESYQKGFEIQSKMIGLAYEFCTKNNISFFVMIIPTKEEIDGQAFQETTKYIPLESFLTKNKIKSDLQKYLTEHTIPIIKISEVLIKENKNNNLYYKYDGHWNTEGHKLVANLMFNQLSKLPID